MKLHEAGISLLSDLRKDNDLYSEEHDSNIKGQEMKTANYNIYEKAMCTIYQYHS